jgi:hypothetical protein
MKTLVHPIRTREIFLCYNVHRLSSLFPSLSCPKDSRVYRLLLCPINATSSFSYVFRLENPRVFHCRIVPIEKMKTVVALRRKTSRKPFRFKMKGKHLKVTRNFREHMTVERVNIFTKRLFATTDIYCIQIYCIYCIFIIYDKTKKIFIVFIINHKNTINTIYLVRLLWWRTNVS